MNPQSILEEEIIFSLLNNTKYFSSVIHHLTPDFFQDPGAQAIIKNIKKHYITYHNIPSMRELVLGFRESDKNIKKHVQEILRKPGDNRIDDEMLMDQTEKFIKLSMFREAIIEGADALGSNNHDKMTDSYSKAEKAVSVNLTSDLGVGIEEIDKIYDDFQDKPGILTGIPSWDAMFGAGVTSKTLSAIAAASGVGKSATMVDFAVRYLLQGLDVVIVTLEMSEAEFYKRVYANLFDIDIKIIKDIDKQVLKNKLQEVQNKIGKLIIKEFPTGSLTPLGLDGFLEQLQTEKNIKSPVVFVDYLGIMSSDKIKQSDNSYAFYGSIAEELRAIAQKRNVVMWTALQLNRSAVNNLEADQSSLSESMKILMILDALVIISQTKEMKEKGELKCSFVKNRFSGKTWDFKIGFDYNKFRFDDKYNLDGENITNFKPDISEIANIGNLMSF